MAHKAKITIRIGAAYDDVTLDFGGGQTVRLDRAMAAAGKAEDGKGGLLPARVALGVIREAVVAQACRNWNKPLPGVSGRSERKGKKWRKRESR